jgi:chromosome segregation ATPase
LLSENEKNTVCKRITYGHCKLDYASYLQAAENEARAKDEIREQYAASERRAMVLAGEIEELRAQLEAAERARKAAESELHEASDRVNELSATNSTLAAQKRKVDNDIQAMQVRSQLCDSSLFTYSS